MHHHRHRRAPARLRAAGFALAAALACACAPVAAAPPAPPSWNDAAVIREATGGRLTACRGEYYDDSCEERIGYTATVVDLNGDGRPEVFTELESECLGGRVGVSLDLYVRDARGRWQAQFGFPGGYTVLPGGHLGYPDLEMTGPGLCAPVWRWNGERYALHKPCPR